MQNLTKAEEQIMQILWELEKSIVRDIISAMAEPKPAYTTVSTIIRILEAKGFVSHKAYGTTYEYFPLISKKDYRNFTFKSFFKDYFNGSIEGVLSYFVEEKNMDIKEIDEILKQVKK